MKKSKKATFKKIKETGWHDFVTWAIRKNKNPDTMTFIDFLDYRSHVILMKLVGNIESDLFSSQESSTMVGLSKQVEEV